MLAQGLHELNWLKVEPLIRTLAMCRQPPSFTSPALANIYHLLRGKLPEWQNLESRARRKGRAGSSLGKSEDRNPNQMNRSDRLFHFEAGLKTAPPCLFTGERRFAKFARKPYDMGTNHPIRHHTGEISAANYGCHTNLSMGTLRRARPCSPGDSTLFHLYPEFLPLICDQWFGEPFW
jgi:hypothetical protein